MERLTRAQMDRLEEINNWAEVLYDNNGILVRRSAGSDTWLPVTEDQIQRVAGKLDDDVD